MNLALNQEAPVFAKKLAELDSTLTNCMVIIITVKVDGTFDMVTNCRNEDIDAVLDGAKMRRGPTSVTDGEGTVQ